MLKIKVKERTHQTIAVISKYLCILGFIGAVGFFGYTMVKNYQQASTILSDSVVIDADIGLSDVTFESGRKGRTKEVYHFTYHFDANGESYEETFTTSENNADKYIDLESIQVAYSKSNPELFGKLDQLEKNSSIGSLTWRALVALLGLMFLAAVIHGLITGVLFVNKDNPETE